MLGVVGQQCYVRLHGALVLKCYSVFQKKKRRKMFFQLVTQAARKDSEGKIRVLPIKSHTYDLLFTIQPDDLPLSYRPNDE